MWTYLCMKKVWFTFITEIWSLSYVLIDHFKLFTAAIYWSARLQILVQPLQVKSKSKINFLNSTSKSSASMSDLSCSVMFVVICAVAAAASSCAWHVQLPTTATLACASGWTAAADKLNKGRRSSRACHPLHDQWWLTRFGSFSGRVTFFLPAVADSVRQLICLQCTPPQRCLIICTFDVLLKSISSRWQRRRLSGSCPEDLKAELIYIHSGRLSIHLAHKYLA